MQVRRVLSQNDRDVIAAFQARAMEDAKAKGLDVKVGQKDVNGVEGITIASGLTRHSLKEGADVMVQDDTPVWNDIPKADIASVPGASKQRLQEMQIVKSYDVPWLTVSYETGRNGLISRSYHPSEIYGQRFGLEDKITLGARLEADGYQDLDVLSKLTLTKGLLRGCEAMIIGAHRAAIGNPSAPVIAGAATGGALTDGTYLVYASALTNQGMVQSQASGYFGGATPISVNNVDTVGESTISSASNSITLSGGTSVQSLTGTLTAVSGAYGYNIWVKKDSGAILWHKTVTGLTFTVTDVGLTGTAKNSVDKTANANDGDGILSQLVYQSTLSPATTRVTDLSGAPFTFDGFGNCVEIRRELRIGYKKFGVVPKVIYCHVDVFQALSDGAAANVPNWIVLQASLVGQLNKVWTGQGPSLAVGGAVIAVVHPVTGTIIPIRPHRAFPERTLAAWSYENTMPDTKEPNSVGWYWTQPLEQVQWAPTDFSETFGVYGAGVVRCPWMGGAFMLTNCDAASDSE